MGYRNVLVHVDAQPECRHRLNAAIDLAERFNAHLTGLVTTGLTSLPYGLDMDPSGQAIVEWQNLVERQAELAATGFEKAVRMRGLDRAETRITQGNEVADIGLNARYADLVVIGQANPSHKRGDGAQVLPGAVVLECARPVLVVPYIGAPAQIGNTVLIAWNGSREACRAVSDALPLLKLAQRVIVMAVNPVVSDIAHGPLPGADLAAYLARHDVKVEARADPGDEVDVGEELLSRAADLNADLLVMGAYGHARAREWMFGGATRTILQSMTLPVLMSH